MKTKHLYIGKGIEPNTGYTKITGYGTFNQRPLEPGMVFTLGFILRSEAERYYGKGNYIKINYT